MSPISILSGESVILIGQFVPVVLTWKVINKGSDVISYGGMMVLLGRCSSAEKLLDSTVNRYLDITDNTFGLII